MALVKLVTPRRITVVTTRGEKKTVEYAGNEWGGLKTFLQAEGYNLTQMKAVEGTYKTTLEHHKAVLPETDFNLFLMPTKSVSGAAVKKAVKKVAKKATSPKAKSVEIKRNYMPEKTTEELQEELRDLAIGLPNVNLNKTLNSEDDAF